MFSDSVPEFLAVSKAALKISLYAEPNLETSVETESSLTSLPFSSRKKDITKAPLSSV